MARCNALKIPKNFYNNFIIYFGYKIEPNFGFSGKIDKLLNSENDKCEHMIKYYMLK